MNVLNVARQLFFVHITLSVFWILIFSSCKADETDNILPSYTVRGLATGARMMPTVTGSGSASLTGTFNPNNRLLSYNSSWTILSGVPIGGGFYGGGSGILASPVGTAWVFNGSLTSTGSTSGSLVLTSAQAQELLLGSWFFKYNTTSNPSGEVAGQVKLTR